MASTLSAAVRAAKARMVELGWNQADLAREMSKRGARVAEGLISRWLSGQRSPNRENSAVLFELLGVAPKLWTPARKKAA